MFNGIFTKHQTGVPFTYDDDYVYLNDKDLYIFAWGGGTSDKRQFLQEEFPEVPLTQACHPRYFAEVIHGIGQHGIDQARQRNLVNARIENYLVQLNQDT